MQDEENESDRSSSGLEEDSEDGEDVNEDDSQSEAESDDGGEAPPLLVR